jgi:hypothetical protein
MPGMPPNPTLESDMRNQKDRRSSNTVLPQDKQTDLTFQERRHIHNRRMENMSMEERQLQFSEMPSHDFPKEK